MNKTKMFALLMAFLFISQLVLTVAPMRFIPEVEATPTVTEESCSTRTDWANGTGVFSTRKCRVWDGNSWEKWYVKQGFGADDTTYQIANGNIGYELHKDFGNLTYYNINFNETRVTMEHWTVEVNTGGAWHDTLVHTVEPTISYHSNTTGLYLTMVKEKNDLRLELVHVIEEGLPMKHNLNIKSTNSTSYEYRLVQNWDGIQNAAQVVQRGGNTSTTVTLGSIANSSASNGHTFIFRNSAGTDLVEESQLSARGQFHHVLYGLSGEHGYAKYYFQNAVNQTLASGEHFTVDPTTASVSRDSSTNYSGTWLGTGTSGSVCDSGGGNPNWYDDSAHSNMQVGKEDASRCYVVKLVYDLSSIPTGMTVTQASVDFTSAGVHTHYCQGSGGGSGTGSCELVEIVYVPNSVDNCAGTTDGDVYRTGALIEDDGGIFGAEGHPHTEWEGNDIELDSAIFSSIAADIDAGGTACLVFSQYLSASDSVDIAGDSGGQHGFFAWNTWGLDFDFTYVAGPTHYTQTINIRAFDESTAVTFLDPEIEIQMTNGTTLAFANCDSGTVGTCNFKSQSDSDDSWEIRIRLGGTNVEVEGGKPSHNITASATASHDIDISLYKSTLLTFYDDNGALASPQNVTTNFANGTSKNFATFDSAGARTIGWVTNGTNTVEAVYRLGGNRILNSSATFAVTGDSQSFSFKQKVFLLDFSFTSISRALQGITPSAISFSVNNGTVGDTFTPTSFATPFQFGNDTITMKAIRFQGQNMIHNSTGVAVSATGKHSWVLQYFPVTWNFKSNDHALAITPTNFQHLAPNSTEITQTDFTKISYYGNGTLTPKGVTYKGQGMIKNVTAITINEEETNLINLQYYKVPFDFKSDDHALSITPSGFTFTAPNASKLEITDFTKTSYFGNGTLTPEGISYKGQGMIKNVTGVTISAEQAQLFNLQYYKAQFHFLDDDHTLHHLNRITPTNFQFLAPNSTEVTITDFTKVSYYGNGSITPKGVTYQGQGMIKNTTAISISGDRPTGYLINLKYYKQTFEFDSHDHVLKGITPTVFQHTAPNGTEVFTDFAKPSYYGNGTLTPEGITFNGQGILANATGITISATDTHSWETQWYKLNFRFYSNDGLLDITPTNMQLTFPNGTVIVMTADFDSHFVGNGTLTPAGITYQGQGMIKNQTAIVVSDGGLVPKVYSFMLKYYKQDLDFATVDSAMAITPTNFQVVLSNSTEKTITTDFDSIYVGNGTITPRGLTFLGQGVILNQTAWASDADETHLFRVQLYKRIFEFQSDDLVLNITPALFQYTAPNGTVIDQTAKFDTGVYIGNGTLTPKGIKYQGTGMIKNVTALTISAADTDLFRLRYYSVPFRFTTDDGSMNITPERFQFTSVNSTEVQMTDFTKVLYLGNGTLAPEGITDFGQGVIKNTTSVTIDSAETHLFRLKIFKLDFDFASTDSLLNPVPTLIQWTAPNGTIITQSANYDGHYIGNGTFTPRGIKFQGTGMINNVTGITVDSTETWLFRMNYMKQNFGFRNTLSSNIVTPTNFIITLANGTQVTLTSYTGIYFGNQTVASVDTLTVSGMDTKKNSTGFVIATDNDSWLFWSLECCTATFVFASVGHVLDGIQPSTFEFDLGNGTYVTLTDFTDAQFADGDTLTPRAVRFQGQNMILNSTAFSINDSAGLTQTFLINIQYYKVNWDFVSVDSELDLYSTLTNFQYVAPNGTAITQNSDFINTFLGNGTLNPVTLKFKGQGVLVNNTGITIDTAETHLIRAQWYKVGFIFASNDHVLNITPDHIQFLAPNGTVIVFTNDAHFAGHYIGNGTITPHGITYKGQGMLKNQTAIVISEERNHLFNLQYYRVTFNFVSEDGILDLTPTNFKAVVANNTLTPFTATHTTLYLGNGTLTPHVITLHGQNIIKNMTGITIDADETHLMRGRYYRINWDFLSDSGTLLTNGDEPNNFIYTLGNSTVVTQTANMDAWYSANQTLTPFSILWDGTSIHKNQTQFSISDDGTIAMRTKVYTINFVFRSTDDALTITPDNFIMVLSNGTEVTTTIPNRASGWLLANGTLTPNKIGFQGTNMILNATAITLDSTETHLLYMRYYPITFEFMSDDLVLTITPTNMTFTGANGTQATATSFASAVYLGNQTSFTVDSINFQNSDMKKNMTSLSISGAGSSLFRIQYLPVKAQVHGFNDVQSSELIEQIFVFNINGTNSLILTADNGSRTWYSGNGTLEMAPAWQDIRAGSNYSTLHSSSNFFDIDGSGDANSTIIIMSLNVFQANVGTFPAVWFAIEDTDIACQQTIRTNTTCVTFGDNRLTISASADSTKTLKLQLRTHPECVSVDHDFITGTCLNQPDSILINTTLYEFPEQNWSWDGINKVMSFDLPFQSTLNMTIALAQNATIGSSDMIFSLENTNTCLKAGDLICTITSPYTRAGSLGLWFYGLMMMMPVGMVWLRSQSMGPTFILMIIMIWIFGVFAPGQMGTAILPPELTTFSYIFVALSIALTLWKLLKRG